MKDFRAISENLFMWARNINVGVGDWTACILSPGPPKDRFFFIMSLKKNTKPSLCNFLLKLEYGQKIMIDSLGSLGFRFFFSF